MKIVTCDRCENRIEDGASVIGVPCHLAEPELGSGYIDQEGNGCANQVYEVTMETINNQKGKKP